MSVKHHFKDLGFTPNEIDCYLALVDRHPVNGSQLSKTSGVSRSKIYEVLRRMAAQGSVLEVEKGLYAPLPPEELAERFRTRLDVNLKVILEYFESRKNRPGPDHLWNLSGYSQIMDKARRMIGSAREEAYLRLAPGEAQALAKELSAAQQRGVQIKHVSMGPSPLSFEIQVIHPEYDKLMESLGGRPFTIIVDRNKALAGIFQTGREDDSPITWTRNHWFIASSRDSLRHDFYHCFLHKIHYLKQPLTSEEEALCEFIRADI